MRVLFYTALSMAAMLAAQTDAVSLEVAGQSDLAESYELGEIENIQNLVQVASEVDAEKKKKSDKKKSAKEGK